MMDRFLVARFKEGGFRQISIAIGDGDAFVLGRDPDPGLAALPSEAGQTVAMRLGNVDGTVSRTHAWGQRRGDHLVVNRIPPPEGKQTPHPLVSLFGDREPLPDTITLAPGESFGIHRRGWLEFRWVDDPWGAANPNLSEVPSYEMRGRPVPSADLPAAELLEFHQRLPRAVGSWTDAAGLFTNAVLLLQSSLPGRPRVRARFLKVDPGPEFIPLDREPVIPLGKRVLRELYGGASAIKGIPRMVSASSGTVFEPGHSVAQAFDWIVALPVGASRPEAGSPSGGAVFEPLLIDGCPVCLYVEAQHSSHETPEAILPCLQLLAALVAEALRGEDRRRVAQAVEMARRIPS